MFETWCGMFQITSRSFPPSFISIYIIAIQVYFGFIQILDLDFDTFLKIVVIPEW